MMPDTPNQTAPSPIPPPSGAEADALGRVLYNHAFAHAADSEWPPFDELLSDRREKYISGALAVRAAALRDLEADACAELPPLHPEHDALLEATRYRLTATSCGGVSKPVCRAFLACGARLKAAESKLAALALERDRLKAVVLEVRHLLERAREARTDDLHVKALVALDNAAVNLDDAVREKWDAMRGASYWMDAFNDMMKDRDAARRECAELRRVNGDLEAKVETLAAFAGGVLANHERELDVESQDIETLALDAGLYEARGIRVHDPYCAVTDDGNACLATFRARRDAAIARGGEKP